LGVPPIPSLSIPAGLLGFFAARAWIHVNDVFGVSHLPFIPQENTAIQTCVVACSGIVYSGMCLIGWLNHI
ncbi:hypothetical protein BAE44_0013535, partial [Dichanthelium oligosanthes]